MAALREGWHHSRFQPYLKSLAPRVAPEATTLGAVSPRVCAEVDVGALLHNADACRAAAEKSGCGVIAVVKADAYGHGAAVVARALHKHAGIDFFAVATLPEALELRAAGLEPGAARVLVLGASVPSEWNVYARFGLEMVVESRRTAELLGRLGKDAGPLKAHVMLNTGMNRIGLATFDSTTETHGRKSEGVARPSLAGAFADLDVVPEDGERSPVPLPPAPEASKAPLPRSDSLGSLGSLGSSGRCQVYHGVQVDQAVCVVAAVARAPAVEVAGLCTHMADATANTHRYTQRQFGRFRDVVVALAEGGVAVPLVHVENSETLLSAHVGPERMRRLIAAGASGGYCRVGGALYGQRGHDVLRPVLSLKAQVRHVHALEAGMTVGYDRSWIAPEDCLIATLAIGFADGYPRSLSNRGVVAVRGHRFRVAGKVCMDMCMVYLGPVGGPGACVEVGDYATLWGDAPGAASLAETAEMVGTAQSDLTCDLSRRVARRYVNLPPDWETPELFAS
mmetsp:Transcript_3731/g.11023  ORF Transcript_3731/g.11023 Transcript_3731/m.11023 type:complete len:509 (-) Transcript_3731:29-1555(-)